MTRGFGNIPAPFITCEMKIISTPASNQTMTVYRAPNNKIYTDLDDLLTTYSLDGNEPGLEKIKFRLVKPKGSHPENEPRRGIDIGSVNKLLRVAITEASTPEGRLWAEQDMRSLTETGMQKMGIDGCRIENGRLIPISKDGKKIEKYSFDLSGNYEVMLAALKNLHPFFEKMRSQTGCNFYSEIAAIAHRRIQTLTTNQEIAAYLEFLIDGMRERQPELEETNYIQALFLFLTDGFSSDRRELLIQLLDKATHPPEYLFDDLLQAIGRVAQDLVIAPNKSERVLTKQDFRALDPFWQGGAGRLAAMADAMQKAEEDYRDQAG